MKKTAVVVDDDLSTQQLMIKALSKIDFEARGFLDGESALAFLEGTDVLPDIIAIDLLLPRMSGYELARRIRETRRLACIPLLLTTAREHLPDEVAAVELGAAFLHKPFRVRDYLDTLQTAVKEQQGKKPLVLVVDDDPSIREAVMLILEEEGFDATGAADGNEALRMLSAGVKPALVVLDVMMPGMDGIQLAYRMRTDASVANVPLFLFSANQQVASMAREVGAVAHLRKPADLFDLVAKINDAVGPPMGARVGG